MIKNCLICLWYYDDVTFSDVCTIQYDVIKCPLCVNGIDAIYHSEIHIGYKQESYQCINCNKYIIYKENNLIIKEEAILDDDYYLINDYFTETSNYGKIIYDENKPYIEIPYIIKFEPLDKLIINVNKHIKYSPFW